MATPDDQLRVETHAKMVSNLALTLPEMAEAPFKFQLDGFSIEVREHGADGKVTTLGTDDRTLTFPRKDGRSFWVRTVEGYEEWLLIDRLVLAGAESDVLAARWSIAGARLQMSNGVVYLLDELGRVRMAVSAPRAFVENVQVPVSLRINGQDLEVRMARAFAFAGPVLIDPLWTPGGTMSSERFGHVATLLPSGGVLVVGGTTTSTYLPYSSAELYTPSTAAWTQLAAMTDARTGHTGTLLQSGKLLVVGGTTGTVRTTTVLDSSEVYDSVNNRWADAGKMNFAHTSHTATMIRTGEVLVAGGTPGAPEFTEIYYPPTSTWFIGAPMNVGRTRHCAVLLPSGKVMVAGNAAATSSVEIFDPATNAWSFAAPLQYPREHPSCVVLNSGKVLVVGGSPVSFAELFDAATNTWALTGAMVDSRATQTATISLMLDGRVLLSGGYTSQYANAAEVYDPSTNQWSPAGQLSVPRAEHTATVLSSGRVLIAGGVYNQTYASSELFDPTLGVGCSTPASCLSGICVSGVCCDSPCDGGCGTCTVTGNRGVCVPVGAGSPGIPGCAPFVCNGSRISCPTTCASAADCPTTKYCVAGACVPRLGLATVCSVNDECLSDHCVDGVCCNSSCVGECGACNLPGSLGSCTVFDAGTLGQPGCRQNFCNGIDLGCPTHCRIDSECTTGHCVDGVCCDRACSANCETCAINGICQVASVQLPSRNLCGPYRCDGVSPDCTTSCPSLYSCASNAYCDAGACVFQSPNGSSCTSSEECQSRSCSQGVCCNTECGGSSCTACNLVGTVGRCTPLDAGSVVAACGAFACVGQPSCPHSCTSDEVCVSGHACINGTCLSGARNGSSCISAQDCASGHCSDNVCCGSACAGSCDTCAEPGHEGSCTLRGPGSAGEPRCTPALCTGQSALCPTMCTASTECVPGYVCAMSRCIIEPDAGVDAGTTADGGPEVSIQVIGETLAPSSRGCGCNASPMQLGVTGLVMAIWSRKRRTKFATS